MTPAPRSVLWRRHGRFLIALAAGLVAALVAPVALIDRVLLGGDLFFAVYLLLALHLAAGLTSATLRENEDTDDEGAGLIIALAIGAVGLSLWAVIGSLSAGAGPQIRPVLAVASVPLGWLTLHMVMAFHYARLFYAQESNGRASAGLDFPGGGDPEPWDFVYFSLTLGMTAQTSDVAVTTTAMRRVVTLHSALSFFFNAVIVALAVNLAVTLGSARQGY